MLRPPPIALVWFFTLGGLGIFFPFFSLYLRENAGLTGTQVGIALAVLPLVGIAAQPLWGQIADRTGSRSRVLFLLALGAALGYAMLYFAKGFLAIVLGTAALACFSTALLPACVSVTLALTRNAGPLAFGLMRVWGTVGFLVLVTAFPRILDALQESRGLEAVSGGPSEPGLELMFPLAGALVLIGALVALALPRNGALALRAPRGDWRRLLQHRPFVRLLGFALLAFLCLQGPMGLFPIFVRSHGGSLASVSQMWILMLVLEIPLVALSGATLARIGPRGLLAVGVLAGGLRWTVCGFATDLIWIYPVQILHGVVVAGLVIGGPLYVDAAVPPRLRSTGQGMLAMIGVSVGGISSNLASGWLLENAGADAPYIAGGIGALLLGCLIPLLLPPASRPAPLLGEEEEGEAARPAG
jgi:PPP family 3-phenylpropionic acid transporter